VNADFLITNIGQLVVVTPAAGPKRGREMRDLGILRDAALAAKDGVIVAVGARDEVMRSIALSPDARVIDAGGRLVGPGFVDAHTHLVFGGWRHEEYAMRCEGRSYLEIAEMGGGILSTVRAPRNASVQELEERARRFLDLMTASGTTTVEAKSGYGLSFEAEVKQMEVVRRLRESHPADLVSTFLGAHAVPEEYKGRREAYVDSVISMLPEIRRRALAEFVDVFCDAGAFTIPETEKILRAAREMGFGLKVHADELEWTGATELACRMGAASCDHLLKVSDDGIEMLAGHPAGAGQQATHTVAVLLPATSVFLGKTQGAPARKLIDRGAAVALGTDFNPGTCTALSMPLVMTLACSLLHMSPEEAFIAATWNAAWAVGLGDRVGSLSKGYQADVVLFDACDYREIPYRFGWNTVSGVYKKGREVWSKRPVVED